MAYSEKIKQKAKELWLLGNSDSQICAKLKIKHRKTLIEWRKKEDWQNNLKNKTSQESNRKTIEKISDQLAETNKLHADIYKAMIVRGFNLMKEQKGLTASEYRNIIAGIDQSLKGHRAVLRLDDDVTKPDEVNEYKIIIE